MRVVIEIKEMRGTAVLCVVFFLHVCVLLFWIRLDSMAPKIVKPGIRIDLGSPARAISSTHNVVVIIIKNSQLIAAIVVKISKITTFSNVNAKATMKIDEEKQKNKN